MLTLVFCLRRKAELDRAAFQRYWREEHGPLMRKNMAAFGARRYVQLHAIDGAEAEFIATSRGTQEPYDALSWWNGRTWRASAVSTIATTPAPPAARCTRTS